MEEHSRPKDDEFIPTRQSLLSRLRDWRDGESWQEFFDNYWRLIYGAAVKAGLTDAEAQDVVQETLISVSKSMPQFHYDPRRGSFKGWLLQLTGWRIADQFAKRLPEKRPPSRGRDSATGTALLDQIADPESVNLEALWDEEWEKNIMVIAIERARRKVDPKQYQIFDYCVLKGLPVPRVAAALHVNRGRVYLVKHRITKLIKKEVAILMARPF